MNISSDLKKIYSINMPRISKDLDTLYNKDIEINEYEMNNINGTIFLKNIKVYNVMANNSNIKIKEITGSNREHVAFDFKLSDKILHPSDRGTVYFTSFDFKLSDKILHPSYRGTFYFTSFDLALASKVIALEDLKKLVMEKIEEKRLKFDKKFVKLEKLCSIVHSKNPEYFI